MVGRIDVRRAILHCQRGEWRNFLGIFAGEKRKKRSSKGRGGGVIEAQVGVAHITFPEA